MAHSHSSSEHCAEVEPYPNLEELLRKIDEEEQKDQHEVESLESILQRLDKDDHTANELPEESALIKAVYKIDLFQVQALCRDKADPNIRSLSGEAAIKLAVQTGDTNLVALLLGWGASPKLCQIATPEKCRKDGWHYIADAKEALDLVSPIKVLCDMFLDGFVQSDQQCAVLSSLDPGALAQVRKFLSLKPPFALGGVSPYVTICEASGVAFEPTDDHFVRLHSLDALRPVLSLLPRQREATAAVVLLHGFLQSGRMLEQIARDMSWALPHARILAPTAPFRGSALGYGPTWFDPTSTDERNAQIEEGQLEIIRVLAGHDGKGVPPDRVVLAGFSLGGTLAAFIALKAPQRLAGLVLIGSHGLLPCEKYIDTSWPGACDLPVLQCHGDSDRIASMEGAKQSAHALGKLDCQVRFSPHEGIGHFMSAAMIAEVLAWVSEKLPP